MDKDEQATVLRQIEANQRTAIELQKQHLDLAKAQLERSNQSIDESIGLQRLAVDRQSFLTKMLLPIVGILLVLFVYLLVRWNIL